MEVVLLYESARLPERKTPGAAGYDLVSAVDDIVAPGRSRLIGTGVCLALPKDTVGIIKSRSSLSVHFDVEVGAGVIDEDYRGEIQVLLRNFGTTPYVVSSGSRIAQLLIVPIAKPKPIAVPALDSTFRGEGGFGSTGDR